MALDPFIKVHALGENDNGAMDYVCELLTKIAIDLNVAVDIPQHTRKGPQTAGDSDAGRGASATRDAGRLFYTLTRMSEDEAKAFGVPAEQPRACTCGSISAKAQYRPAERSGATWFRLVGVPARQRRRRIYPAGDDVQTVERSGSAEDLDGVSGDAAQRGPERARGGPCPTGQRYTEAQPRAAARARLGGWCSGTAPTAPSRSAARSSSTWVKNGVLVSEDYDDPIERRPRKGLFVCDAKRPT